LESVLLPETILQRVQFAILGYSFDGRDAAAAGLNGEHGTRLDCLAIIRTVQAPQSEVSHPT